MYCWFFIKKVANNYIKNIRQHVSFCSADELIALCNYYYVVFESEGVSILSYDFDRL